MALTREAVALAEARALAQSFRRLVRERDAAGLAPWLARAEDGATPGLREFAAGVRRDYAAVEAGLREPWISGQVEGQLRRRKLIKRQGDGRANLPLLTRRAARAS